MAYTYDDFISAAQKAGQLEKFSQQDLVTAQKSPEFGLSMLSLYRDMDSAGTAEQKLLATEAANQLRKSYGSYTVDASGQSSFSGSYGDRINQTMDKLGSYGDFQYGRQEDYRKLLDKVAGADGYSYDPSTDPAMSAYKKTYLREGERASANALAQASAGTGGVPSSFAVTAANQAGSYYAGQLADKIPELQQTAYQRDQSALSAIQSDRQLAYDDYLNQYNMLLSMLDNQQTQEQTEYNRYLDAWNQAQQLAQQKENTAATTYDRLVSLITNVGYNPTDEELTAAGMTRAQADAYLKAYGGGGSGYGGNTSTDNSKNVEILKSDIQQGISAGATKKDVVNYLQAAKQGGYINEKEYQSLVKEANKTGAGKAGTGSKVKNTTNSKGMMVSK